MFRKAPFFIFSAIFVIKSVFPSFIGPLDGLASKFSLTKAPSILLKLSGRHMTLKTHPHFGCQFRFFQTSEHCRNDRALEAGGSVAGATPSPALLLEIRENESNKPIKQ
jgi:hypothetical protein